MDVAGIGRAVASRPEVGQPIWIGWGFAIASSVAFSIAPPIVRGFITDGVDPLAMLQGRMVLATLIMATAMGLQNRRRLHVDRDFLLRVTAAGMANAVGMISFFLALVRIDASMASMIISLSPVVVLSLLALRGEKVTYRHAIRLALAIGGIYLLIGPGGQVDLVGVALVIVATLGFAVQLVIIQWFLVGYDGRTVTFYLTLTMTIAITGWWLYQGAPWAAPGTGGWIAIVVLAVVSTYVARLLMFAGVSRIGGGQMSMLAPLETLLTVIWSMLFLSERLTWIQWIGGLLILASALLAIQRMNIRRRRNVAAKRIL